MSSTSQSSAPTGRHELRRIRVESVMGALLSSGPISRTDLAAVTGYSPSTVTGIVQELQGLGYLHEVGHRESTGGRRRTLVELDRTAIALVVAEISGGRIHASLIDLDARVLATQDSPFDPADPVNATALAVAGLGEHSARRPTRLVLALPGVVAADGTVSLAPAFAAAGDPQLAQALSRQTGLPVTVENDVNLIALGERSAGAAAGVDDLILIHIAEGIGATILTGGRLLHGSTRSAGEVGFLPTGLAPLPHGNRGSFEERWSTPAIAAAARDAGLDVTEANVIRQICTAPAAAALRGEVLDAWAWAAVVCACVLNPALVLFSGDAIGLDDAARSQLADRIRASAPSAPEVTFASLGIEAVLFGAVARVLEDPASLITPTG
ncbi:ROK family transcriptional regulator [Arthrobacter sp. Sa2BUA2]|uniref:ROK family transcriptional regulator n=1 Tax=Arthrobacter pullicola TaxID=2762224 RepID=A0ABR8YGE7_9MICC|nr:ROK family transcriptional regulator [Arthrobacter pullicola]MBD8043294.1 ROK family transcriptional regulator [Arthrobacter pullicola]